METKKAKITVLVSLTALAGLAVILLPTYAGDLEPIARPEPKLHRVYKGELTRDDLIAKATLPDSNGAATATGYSESFSFDEAFKNALDALPADTNVYPDKMEVVKVVEIGAAFGGIAGVAHMYVRVRREPDPASASATRKQRTKPRLGIGKPQRLPGREIKFEVSEPKPIEEK